MCPKIRIARREVWLVLSSAIGAGGLCLELRRCSSHFLGNGYEIVTTDGYNRMIANPAHRIIIFPDIVDIQLVDTYVIGCRQKSLYPLFDRPDFLSNFGYFVLDTSTGSYVQGLTSEGLKGELSKKRISISISLAPCAPR
jgi:hypothetical protein